MTKLPPPRAIKTAILKMDSTVVNKEGIEKVLTMLPTEEERIRIQEAQNLNPDIPLGSAEQFLLTLASISQLEARLRLWAFKLDFEISEKVFFFGRHFNTLYIIEIRYSIFVVF